MRNLPQPTRAGERADLKKAVRRYRYRGKTLGHDITDDELDQVIALYDLYGVGQGLPSNALRGGAMPPALLSAIHDAYAKTQNGRTLVHIRERLFKDVDLCPVCGIDPVTELDHHLPQSEYKALSIHARNLVPMCHLCNHAKLAGFDVDGNGFLHPYFDVLPDLNFLLATIELNGSVLIVDFSIDAAAVLPAGFPDRLTGQMAALKLGNRYQREVNTYISSQAASLHIAYNGTGQEGVRTVLRLQTRYETRAFHRNHWRPTLLRALASHDHFTGGAFSEVLPIPHDMLVDLEP